MTLAAAVGARPQIFDIIYSERFVAITLHGSQRQSAQSVAWKRGIRSNVVPLLQCFKRDAMGHEQVTPRQPAERSANRGLGESYESARTTACGTERP